MIKKLLNDQRGSVMLYLLIGSLGVILALTFTMLLGTMGKFSFSKESGDAYNSVNAWEGCVQKFNKTANRFTQTDGCSPGDCLNFTTETACTPCGSTDSKLAIGNNCGCQMQYNEKQLVVNGSYSDIYSVFDVTGSCNSASYTDLATLKTCLPSENCIGKACGSDDCGGSCGTCLIGTCDTNGQCI